MELVLAVRDDGGLGRDAELKGLKHVANIGIRRGLLRRRPSDTKRSLEHLLPTTPMLDRIPAYLISLGIIGSDVKMKQGDRRIRSCVRRTGIIRVTPLGAGLPRTSPRTRTSDRALDIPRGGKPRTLDQ